MGAQRGRLSQPRVLIALEQPVEERDGKLWLTATKMEPPEKA